MKDMQKKDKGFRYIYSKGGMDISIDADNPNEELFSHHFYLESGQKTQERQFFSPPQWFLMTYVSHGA